MSAIYNMPFFEFLHIVDVGVESIFWIAILAISIAMIRDIKRSR